MVSESLLLSPTSPPVSVSDTVLVLLFARLPDLGQVKTRLATGIGQPAALQIHEWLAQKQASALRESKLPWQLWVTPGGRTLEANSWLQGAGQVHTQCEGDLGERLVYATNQAFGQGARGVILIGTDCPYLDANPLQQLAQSVAQGRFALIPALDGGYVAFGLPQPLPSAFSGIAWSTPGVLGQTVAALAAAGYAPEMHPPLSDCDEIADLIAIAKAFPDCPYQPESTNHP